MACQGEIVAPQTFIKQPSERRQYGFDFSALLLTTETITSITSITSQKIGGGSSSLVIDTQAISGQVITFWISSGASGFRYKVEATVITSQGQTLEGDGILRIRD